MMQTYLIHLQFPNQEAHIKGAYVFTQYIESGWESDNLEVLKAINRDVNPEVANVCAIVKASNDNSV